MIIKLNEIRDGGETFDFSRQDTDITADLDDLLKGGEFQAQVRITPAGQAFDLKGSLLAKVSVPCSFCATEFTLPLKRQFHDILLVGTKIKTDLKISESHLDDGELEAIELTSNNFDVSEALHEQLALAEPLQPKCKEDCKGLCLTCGNDLNETTCACSSQGTGASNSRVPGTFSVLKSLKLN